MDRARISIVNVVRSVSHILWLMLGRTTSDFGLRHRGHISLGYSVLYRTNDYTPLLGFTV